MSHAMQLEELLVKQPDEFVPLALVEEVCVGVVFHGLPKYQGAHDLVELCRMCTGP